MCLSLPGRVLSVEDVDPAFRCGCVDFRGVRRTINLALAPEVKAGDYVLVHVGVAIARVSPEEAARIYADFEEIGAL